MGETAVIGLTLDEIAYLRELLANQADARAALSRAVGGEARSMAEDAVRNADQFWTAFGVPLMMAAIDVAERTLRAAGPAPDIRRAHVVVLTAASADPADLAAEMRALAGRLDGDR